MLVSGACPDPSEFFTPPFSRSAELAPMSLQQIASLRERLSVHGRRVERLSDESAVEFA
jgi:hypothetical protein